MESARRSLQLLQGNAATPAAPTRTTTAASPIPDASPSPASRASRRRGHRAQSAVWRFLTTAENPHHSTSTECMHCRRQVPHHRKNEKARAHLRRCVAFRDKMAELPPAERPAWVDLTAHARGASSRYATRRASTQAPSHGTRASSPSPSLGMSASGLGVVVSDVEMVAESLIAAPVQTTAAAGGEGGSGQDGHDDGQAEREQRGPSDCLGVDRSDERGGNAALHSSMGIQSVQDAVSMHVFMTGVAIESVAEANLATAFRLANCAVALPTPEEMRGPLLDRAYQRVRAKVDADMHLSEYNALSSSAWWSGDSWSDGERPESASITKRTVKYMAVNEVQTFYMGSSRVSEAEWQDPEFLSSEIARLMERSPQRISGAVTDCTPAHRAAWQKLKATYPIQFFQGCASHGLHLLLQDIFEPSARSSASASTAMASTGVKLNRVTTSSAPFSGANTPSPLKQLRGLVQNCRLLVDVFDRESALRTKLRESIGGPGKRLESLPENQLWDTLLASFRSIQAAVPALRTIADDPSFVNDAPVYFQPLRAHVAQIVLEPEFKALLDKAIALVEPLHAALTHFEQQEVPCSEVFAYFAKMLPDAFIKLGPVLSEAERRHLLLLCQSRFNAMYGDGHGIAYMLDPRYIGDGLSVEMRKNIEDMIFAFPTANDVDTNGEAMDEEEQEEVQLEMAQQLTEFVIDATRERTNRTFRFSMLARNKKSVLQYWLTDGQRWPRLQRLACRVFCLPSSALRLDRRAASLAETIVQCSSASAASTTGAASVEDKIQFVRINTLLLGDGGLGGITC